MKTLNKLFICLVIMNLAYIQEGYSKPGQTQYAKLMLCESSLPEWQAFDLDRMVNEAQAHIPSGQRWEKKSDDRGRLILLADGKRFLRIATTSPMQLHMTLKPVQTSHDVENIFVNGKQDYMHKHYFPYIEKTLRSRFEAKKRHSLFRTTTEVLLWQKNERKKDGVEYLSRIYLVLAVEHEKGLGFKSVENIDDNPHITLLSIDILSRKPSEEQTKSALSLANQFKGALEALFSRRGRSIFFRGLAMDSFNGIPVYQTQNRQSWYCP